MADQKPQVPRRPKAKTPEEREQQLIAAAFDLAERQIADGTASAQVITHFLKSGARRTRLEDELLESKNALEQAKVEAMKRDGDSANLLKDAMKAFTEYRGEEDEDAYVQ